MNVGQELQFLEDAYLRALLLTKWIFVGANGLPMIAAGYVIVFEDENEAKDWMLEPGRTKTYVACPYSEYERSLRDSLVR